MRVFPHILSSRLTLFHSSSTSMRRISFAQSMPFDKIYDVSSSHTRAHTNFNLNKWYIVCFSNNACDSHSIFIHENCKQKSKIKLRDIIIIIIVIGVIVVVVIVVARPTYARTHINNQMTWNRFTFIAMTDEKRIVCVCVCLVERHTRILFAKLIYKTLFLAHCIVSDKKLGTHTHRDISKKRTYNFTETIDKGVDTRRNIAKRQKEK